MRVRDEEGCWTSPAFGHKDRSVASMAKYDNVLHLFLRRVQEVDSELIAPSDDNEGNYSFSCIFRRTTKGRMRGAPGRSLVMVEPTPIHGWLLLLV
jgi:hypothetical protein